METDEVAGILSKYRTVAVVGLSPKEDRASYRVANYLKQQGYRVIPVNPAVKEVLGETSYPDLSTVPESVEIVDIFRRAEDVPQVVEEAIKVGAKVIWMQLGIVNEAAASRAREAGLKVVMDKCMKIEHQAIHAPM